MADYHADEHNLTPTDCYDECGQTHICNLAELDEIQTLTANEFHHIGLSNSIGCDQTHIDYSSQCNHAHSCDPNQCNPNLILNDTECNKMHMHDDI